jgi:hypothetical protein
LAAILRSCLPNNRRLFVRQADACESDSQYKNDVICFGPRNLKRNEDGFIFRF